MGKTDYFRRNAADSAPLRPALQVLHLQLVEGTTDKGHFGGLPLERTPCGFLAFLTADKSGTEFAWFNGLRAPSLAHAPSPCPPVVTMSTPPAISAPAAPNPALGAAPVAIPHTHTEDAVAIFTGVLLISVGVAFFTSAGLLTGGTAGLAFLLHYATGIGFGKIFFVLNLPFYWLALRKLGRAFTVKTFLAVLLLSLLTELQSQFLQFAQLQPLYAAIAGGLITGTGFLVLFRHRCSLGGVGIAALYLQDRYGWRAGKVQMAVDCCIVLLALWTVEPLRVAWSIAGAVALNLVLAMNHRPGRYMAV